MLVNHNINNAKMLLKNWESVINSYLPCSNWVQTFFNTNAIFFNIYNPDVQHFCLGLVFWVFLFV